MQPLEVEDTKETRPRPQKDTRLKLQRLDVPELAGVLRDFGLPQICCEEDRRLAEALLPLAGAQDVTIFPDFLKKFTWHQLLSLVQQTLSARGRDGTEELMATYLSCACESLQQEHLRDTAQARQDSVLPWRMRHCCIIFGLSAYWEEISLRLNRNMLLVATCGSESTLLRKEEIRRLQNLVEDCQITPLDDIATEPQRLDNVAVLYVTGHYDGSPSSFKQADLSNVWLVILNMCRTETLAKHLIQQGALHVVCWPAQVPDGIAADFGVAMISEASTCSIAEAFRKALEVMPPSERMPKLLVRSSDNTASPGSDQPEFVVLELPDAGSSVKQAKSAYEGAQGKVLWHTKVNGWVMVVIGKDTVKWRVGNWRIAPNAHGNQFHRDDAVILKPQKQSGKCEYSGEKACVLWDSAKHGWVNVKLGSKLINWRIGHWVPIHEIGGGDCEQPESVDSGRAGMESYAEENLAPNSNACEKHVDTDDFVILKPKQKSGNCYYAGHKAQVLRHSANRGWISVRLDDSKLIKWRIGHWDLIDKNAPLATSEENERLGSGGADTASYADENAAPYPDMSVILPNSIKLPDERYGRAGLKVLEKTSTPDYSKKSSWLGCCRGRLRENQPGW